MVAEGRAVGARGQLQVRTHAPSSAADAGTAPAVQEAPALQPTPHAAMHSFRSFASSVASGEAGDGPSGPPPQVAALGVTAAAAAAVAAGAAPSRGRILSLALLIACGVLYAAASLLYLVGSFLFMWPTPPHVTAARVCLLTGACGFVLAASCQTGASINDAAVEAILARRLAAAHIAAPAALQRRHVLGLSWLTAAQLAANAVQVTGAACYVAAQALAFRPPATRDEPTQPITGILLLIGATCYLLDLSAAWAAEHLRFTATAAAAAAAPSEHAGNGNGEGTNKAARVRVARWGMVAATVLLAAAALFFVTNAVLLSAQVREAAARRPPGSRLAYSVAYIAGTMMFLVGTVIFLVGSARELRSTLNNRREWEERHNIHNNHNNHISSANRGAGHRGSGRSGHSSQQHAGAAV